MWVKVSLPLILLMTLLSFGVNSVVGETKAPDFILVDIDGNSFSLSDCPAKVVLIDFFGTHCTPCIQVIPALRNLYGEYSRNQLEIISISSSDSDAVLRDFAQDPTHIMTWIVASDLSGQTASNYGIQYIPTLYIIDTERSIQHKHIGVTAEATLRSEINSVLSGADNGDSNGDSDTALPWPPIELIAIIGGVAVVFLVGIVVAGQMLGWSKPAKKRRRPRRLA